MSHQNASSDEADDSIENQPCQHHWQSTRQLAITAVVLSLVAVQPALAQPIAVCSADNLPGMIEGFFQITTTLGIVGLAVVWQADSLNDMFTINPEQKKGLKRHKRSAMKSTIIPMLSSIGQVLLTYGLIVS